LKDLSLSEPVHLTAVAHKHHKEESE